MNINNLIMANKILRDEFSTIIKERGTRDYTRIANIIGELDVFIQIKEKELRCVKNKKDCIIE